MVIGAYGAEAFGANDGMAFGGIFMYKIMVIEDDMSIARTIKDHLGKWDYNVIYATDFKNITYEAQG
jgi:hypothetical protein